MGSSRWKAILGAAVLLSVLALASWRLLAPTMLAMQSGSCDLSSGPCNVEIGQVGIEVELHPNRPQPGEEMTMRFTGDRSFEMTGAGNTVDFSMPGMDMGEHLMILQATAPDILEGRIALPACPMGHSLWQASIRISEHPPVEVALHVGE